MAWSNSKIFRATLADFLGRTTNFAMDLSGDTLKAALYDNDITPDNDVTAANTAYNAGQWVITGNEVSDGAEWAAGGVALTSVSLDSSTADTVFLDAADTASGSSATLASVYGCLVYSDTVTTPVADQGLCYNYFGGTNSVTDGTFTIVWHANGILRFTL
ncbi:MAG: hypothetical protein EPO65_00655 [Dehalococcoidia bacterium]|nr:MAG: hypothetical protein EPO65_00655 [Dehalococcoidia bacterium]